MDHVSVFVLNVSCKSRSGVTSSASYRRRRMGRLLPRLSRVMPYGAHMALRPRDRERACEHDTRGGPLRRFDIGRSTGSAIILRINCRTDRSDLFRIFLYHTANCSAQVLEICAQRINCHPLVAGRTRHSKLRCPGAQHRKERAFVAPLDELGCFVYLWMTKNVSNSCFCVGPH